ncbi:unnamed protein product, partial [Protopolystoma xenopodis]
FLGSSKANSRIHFSSRYSNVVKNTLLPLIDFYSTGWVLIDRSGKHFGTILNYLRDGSAALPDSRQDLEELLAEARFFCIEGLRNSCEETLTRLPSIDDAFPRASIVIVKYPKAARALLASTTKSVAILCNLMLRLKEFQFDLHSERLISL